MDQALDIALFAVPVIIAITLHEAAHGYVARHFGDHTASDRGRVTLNPLKHIDPVGTLLLPALLLLAHTGFVFGYAKPVPVDPRFMRNPRRDMMWVAAAGPAMNVLLAVLSAVAIYAATHVAPGAPVWAVRGLWASVDINLTLAVLNLIPLPPLDGSKVVAGLLPLNLARPYARLNRYGMLIVLAVFVLLPMAGLSVFSWLIAGPVDFLERPLLMLLGLRA